MTRDRMEWVLSGLNRTGLNKFEKGFIKQVQGKFERVGNLSASEERQLEQIYRTKS